MFARMALMDCKFTSPARILACLTDEEGRAIPIGDEQDLGEMYIHLT